MRHGETAANVQHRLDTRLPGEPLTDLGHAQAHSAGEALAGRPIVQVVSSAATRARQTAAAVAAALAARQAQRPEAAGTRIAEARVVPGLHEAQVGDWENRNDRTTLEAFMRVYHDWHTGDLDARPPGGESGRQVLDRYLPALDAARPDSGGAIVVVSHGAAIRLASRHLADNVPGEFSARNHLANTESIELVPTATGWTCVRWGLLLPPFVPDDTPLPGFVEGRPGG
mgnify:CR=1 FL=1